MPFFVYILRCSDGSYYTGHTNNLESRVAAHQQGLIDGYTYTRRPVTLAFAEEFGDRADALEREQQIKRWSRKKKDALIRRDWAALRELAKSRHRDLVLGNPRPRLGQP